MYYVGHSPAALPILLGEVYESVCPSEDVSEDLNLSLLNYHKSKNFML
jgi:hypothetical protein